MSMMFCEVCHDTLVDCDAEPEAFAEMVSYSNQAMPLNGAEPPEYICVCWHCREHYVDDAGVFWPDGFEMEIEQ